MPRPGKKQARPFPEGSVPLVRVEGTAFACGEMLGIAWRAALALSAQRAKPGLVPWWRARAFAKLISRHAPHLPDLFRGMARGAGVPEATVGAGVNASLDGGCTSFAVEPRATLDGLPLAGQTKDTPPDRVSRYVVLCLKPLGAPAMLTLTYPGELFGYGFVTGRCALFRNSLYAGAPSGSLPMEAWGLLALHCETVAAVVELTRRHGLNFAGHFTLADCRGGIVGLEAGRTGVAFLCPRAGIYTHANHVASGARLRRAEHWERDLVRVSCHRATRLRGRLVAERGRITAQTTFAALSDHDNHPNSVCSHRTDHLGTTAAVVAEPAKGLLHVTRGAPCQNWPATYALEKP